MEGGSGPIEMTTKVWTLLQNNQNKIKYEYTS